MSETTNILTEILQMILPIKYPLILSTIGYITASIITYKAIHTQDSPQQQSQQTNSPITSSPNISSSPNNISNKRTPKNNGQPLSRSDSGSPASEVVVTSTIIFPKTKSKKQELLPSSENTTSVTYNNINSPTNKGKSSGEYTRKYFYKLLFISLITRLIFIQLEASSLVFIEYTNKTNTEIGDKQCSDNVICILSRTFPDYTFASALSLLVLFYGQLAGTASIGGPTGLSLLLSQNKHIFPIGNAIMYGLYTVLFLLHVIFSRTHRYVTYDKDTIEEDIHDDDHILHTEEQQQQLGLLSLYIFQRCTWFLLLVVYGILLGLISYFGPILVIVLRPSLAKWSGLALRLISMCVLCTIIFITRMLSFAFACYTNNIQYTTGFMASYATKYIISPKTTSNIVYFFTRDVIGNVFYELLPTFIILFMMHSRNNTERRYPQSTSLPGSANTTPPSNYILPTKQGNQQYTMSYNTNYNNPTSQTATSSTNTSTNFMRRNISGSAPKGISSSAYTGSSGGGSHRILMINKNSGNDEIRPLLDHYPNKGYGI